MIVNVFDVDAQGTAKFRSRCDLHECFPLDSRDEHGESDFLRALEDLRKTGHHLAGGGAAPIVLLIRAHEDLSTG